MTTISTDQPVITLVNVFTVDPQQQQALVDVLVEASEAVMHNVPGYVSASIHKSIDGTHVVNYAQWRSTEDYQAMLQRADVRPHLAQAAALARFEPHLYQVVFTDHM